MSVIAKTEAISLIEAGCFDFIDYGCSSGGSIKFAQKRLGGGRGLGIDLSAAKVQQAASEGCECVEMDASELKAFPDKVRFVTMFHFLEHLPGITQAQQCISSAFAVAREFVIMKQPWFDSDGILFRDNLKLYWSDWTGHTFKTSALDLARLARGAGKACRYRIYGRDPIPHSHHPGVLCLSDPPNSHQHEPGHHGVRPFVEFKEPVFRESMLVALLDEMADFSPLEKALPGTLVGEGTC